MLRHLYRLSAKVVFGSSDHGYWIYEKIRRPRTAFTAAVNYLYFRLRVPRVYGAVSAQIEPVFGCNLRCKYCWGSGAVMAKRPHLMTWTIFRQAVDRLPDTVETVTFSMGGEPLLHPELGDMIDYVHRSGRRAISFTNGTKLSGERLKMIAESRLSVLNVSIEPTPETARENRGVDLDEIRENVRELSKIKRPELEIKGSCVITPNNVERLGVIRGYWDGLISEFKFAPYFSDEFGKASPSVCLEIWRGNYNILTNGDVTPCCFDGKAELIVGSILEDDLATIVNGPRMRHLLEEVVRGRPPSRCLRCRQFDTKAAPLRAPKKSTA